MARGRPRIHENDAAKIRAHRLRKRSRSLNENPYAAVLTSLYKERGHDVFTELALPWIDFSDFYKASGESASEKDVILAILEKPYIELDRSTKIGRPSIRIGSVAPKVGKPTGWISVSSIPAETRPVI